VEALEHLAEAYQATGDLLAAREALRQALAIYEGLNQQGAAAATRSKIADLGG
jgi:hypothetical protein